MHAGLRALTGVSLSMLAVLSGISATSADAATTYQLRVSTSASRASAHALQSATLFGTRYVYLSPSTRVAKVRFYVDDVNRRHSPKRTDSTAPFDLVGGTTTKAIPWWTTALKEGTHHLTAAVTSTSGKTTVVQASFTVRNTPKPPLSARAVAADNRVNVFWHSAGGPTRGFNVYRSTSTPVPLTKPLNGSSPLRSSAASFVDRTAHNGTTYRYVVVAVGVHGLHSKPTSTLTARPLPAAPTPPPAPKNVDASAAAGQINVSWTSGGGSTSGFNVYRSTGPSFQLTTPVNDSVLPADASSFADTVTDPGTYFYVVQAVSSGGAKSSPSQSAQATFGAEDIQVTALDPVLYTSRNGSTTGQVQVKNVGDATLSVTGAGLSDATADYFTLSAVAPFSLDSGKSKTLTVSFKPKANNPQRVKLTVHSDDPATPDAFVWIGGLAINDAVGGEPSLQWIIDAYGLAADDGDPTPSTYPLGATSLPPSNGILVRGFTVRDSSAPVRVTVLAAFVGPDGNDPQWGWTPQDTTPGAATATISQRRDFVGTTYSINPPGRFGIWVKVEGTTLRTDLNSASKPRFIAFPVAGQPGTYVVANDTAGGLGDDWNDVPLLIQNVDTIPSGSGG